MAGAGDGAEGGTAWLSDRDPCPLFSMAAAHRRPFPLSLPVFPQAGKGQPLAAIDANSAEGRATGQRFKVSGYPTLIYFEYVPDP